jgi:hypothetical protein
MNIFKRNCPSLPVALRSLASGGEGDVRLCGQGVRQYLTAWVTFASSEHL